MTDHGVTGSTAGGSAVRGSAVRGLGARWAQVPAWRRDVALAVGLALVVLAGAATAPPGRTELDPIGYVLLELPALVIAARRRAPLAVLGVATACLVAYEVRGYPGVVPAVPVMFALYNVVKAGYRWPAPLATLVATLVGGFAGGFLSHPGRADPYGRQQWILVVGWMVASSVMAEVSRQHRAYLEQVEQRALDAERTREETARRRADEERLRIARELHDSLTHSISIIKVQAGVATHLARKRDDPVPEALVAIQQASADAMRELRSTLEVLRSDRDGDGGTDPAGNAIGGSGDDRARDSAGGLDRLDALVDGTRRAGLPVVVTVGGQRRRLPTPVDRVAYRIVQEALTNVTRHAGPATATVHLTYGPADLTVRVDDDGHGNGGADVVPGVGLAGMRERVSALGGSLFAGPRDGGGFRVRAELPLEKSA
ncbi:two-component sensor histidine kinase [Rugosimonospora africana]|uniref:histidine kinase n=2 Tax=Rugosimonospora africana TaxID=556532 RepID=A0A8J3VQF1_9ACTN|nr:two-component sensor histidine kinase [Rugosimonospora africana]